MNFGEYKRDARLTTGRNKMKDRIIDGLTEEHIKSAVAQFEFLGHLVSMSQVFTPGSIAIFKGSFEKHGF